jgi:hypothetical protein
MKQISDYRRSNQQNENDGRDKNPILATFAACAVLDF